MNGYRPISEKPNPKVQRILLWRESFLKLQDNHFFELMRMYLGEIKTPYNKQKLIETLGSFLHKTEIKEKILLLISKEDVQVLSAIVNLECPNQQMLSNFFAGAFPLAKLYDKLMNLEERLILFQYTDENTGKSVYALNPLLEEDILPLLSLNFLFESVENVEFSKKDFIPLSAQFIASVISFVCENPSLCKLDGSLKKKVVQALLEKYPFLKVEVLQNIFQSLLKACINLSLFKQEDQKLIPDFQRWKKFAILTEKEQAAYLVSATCGRDSMARICQRASIVMELLDSVPEEGFTEEMLNRKEFLILNGKKNNSAFDSKSRLIAKSRLSQIMNANTDDVSEQTDSIVKSAIKLGFLHQVGTVYSEKKAKNIEVYKSKLPQNFAEEQKIKKGFVNFDSSFAITVLPGLNLAELLELVRFMDLSRFDTAVTFEINRSSCVRGFEQGMTPQDIETELNKYLAYSIPQHFSVSLEDWFNSFQSASIYKGYVLHLKNGKDAEANPILSKYILVKLENNVYIMNFENDEEAKEVMKQSGLESSSGIKTNERQNIVPNFQKVNVSGKKQNDFSSKTLHSEKEIKDFQDNLTCELNNLNLSKLQTEGLLSRIQRKIILVPQQLQGNSVKQEILEARGMDYNAKIYVTEQAYNTGTLLELSYGSNEQEEKSFLGRVVKFDKKGNAGYVVLQLEGSQETKEFSLAQATLVRRLRGVIFRE